MVDLVNKFFIPTCRKEQKLYFLEQFELTFFPLSYVKSYICCLNVV